MMFQAYLATPYTHPARDPGRAPRAAKPIPDGDFKLGKCEREILRVLAQYPAGRSKVQIAIMGGFSVKGGHFLNSIGKLRSQGLIEGGNDSMRITDGGIAAAGGVDPLPTGDALAEHWYSQLGRTEAAILKALIDEYPAGLTKLEIADRAGYQASGGHFINSLGKLRTLQLINGRNTETMTASDAFFEGA